MLSQPKSSRACYKAAMRHALFEVPLPNVERLNTWPSATFGAIVPLSAAETFQPPTHASQQRQEFNIASTVGGRDVAMASGSSSKWPKHVGPST